MAHLLNIENGTASFFSTKPAWHSLGTIVYGALTSEEALRAARLDFNVQRVPLQTSTGIAVPDRYATVRMDTLSVLGVVGKDYSVVQNVDSFKFFDAVVGADEAIFETAGALGKGEKIFITAKLPAHIQVGDDVVEQYLFLYNSHDGSSAITCAFTPIRVVCNNTLTAAMRKLSNKVSIKHTPNANHNLQQAHKLMGIVNVLSSEMESLFNNLKNTYVTDDKVKELITQALAPTDKFIEQEEFSTRFENMVESVYTYTMEDATQLGIRNSLWGVYNGVTGYYSNEKSYKDDDNKINSMFFGDYNRKAQKTLNLVSALV